MNKKDTEALKLLARFSVSPNKLGYCGHKTGPDAMMKCLLKGECKNVMGEVEHFVALNPYLNTLSEITGLPKFSYEVIESYWIGNNLLKMAKNEHYNILMEQFLKQGVPEVLVNEFARKKPKKFIPHHLFQVLHIGIGRNIGITPFSEKSINSCMPAAGRILSIRDSKADVELWNIQVSKEQKYKLRTLKKKVRIHEGLIDNPKIGEYVAFHWGVPTKLLSNKEFNNLYFWTNEIIDSCNN